MTKLQTFCVWAFYHMIRYQYDMPVHSKCTRARRQHSQQLLWCIALEHLYWQEVAEQKLEQNIY
jgi:hypothetical protein